MKLGVVLTVSEQVIALYNIYGIRVETHSEWRKLLNDKVQKRFFYRISDIRSELQRNASKVFKKLNGTVIIHTSYVIIKSILPAIDIAKKW